ncbi:hypothetical protein EDB81DRAFT_843157 [Dactylonectria macrodidyma]|uniref:Uncharacterized protein n=1 Tax=Dactylonectria macrodidyma TaxID=307937 RepID=A0A9P9J6X1_9HYPO|nr:hypothetical protein EDB81DRAFT_843157 [Dactylonectria macrodidyma]
MCRGIDPQALVWDVVDAQDVDDSIIRNLDDAEALLQPALSAQARHLTSQNTPAIEKVAALEMNRDGFFDVPSDGDGDSSPEPISSPVRSPGTSQTPRFGQLSNGQPAPDPVPSSWRAETRPVTAKTSVSRPSKGAFKSAFAPTRHRSRSAGQEALRRISKAFPSLGSPSHLLPSLPSSFFSSFSDKSSTTSSSTLNPSSSPTQSISSRNITGSISTQSPSRRIQTLPAQVKTSSPLAISTPDSRPKVLRRVTSDDSLLYHSMSRSSSLGDDNQFHDVREMVNTRFMALKDSLPDVPNFKMPNLPRLYQQARKSTLSLPTVYSTDALGQSAEHTPRETRTASKDPSTALDRVLEELTGDVVIMGGYRGSVLRSAEAPHQQLWAPVKLGLNMRKANLEVGLEDEDEERMEETIIPSGMLTHIGPIDISRKFIKKLQSCDNARTGKLRVWNYGYDWRLSPHLLSRKLQQFLQKLPSNQPGIPVPSRGALVIAHSLGGIITRHAVNQRPDLFSSVLYCGTPQTCINILNPLRHGDVVLFNEKLLTAQVNFSIRTSFAFLPENGFCFVDKNTGEEYPINFFDPQEWIKWHLSPCMQPTLPAYNRPHASSFSSRIPKSLRPRSDSKASKLPPSPTVANHNPIMPQLNGTAAHHDEPPPSDPERERYLKYLTQTLARVRLFRAELAHSPVHQTANAYPPLALIYGKSIPTVYGAQVTHRDGIRCQDAYDDLLFRPGDGVVLAKEAMLPDGYALVRGGRVCTERGHITMLGDMPAMGRALEALVRGRQKGIGLGIGHTEG